MENRKKFTSENNKINLGEDIDNIIENYLKDLDNICMCKSCEMFRKVFKNYNRKPHK